MKLFKFVFVCAGLVFASCALFQKSTAIRVNVATDCSFQQQAEAYQVIINRIKATYGVKDFTKLEDGSFSVTYFPKKDIEIVPDMLEKKGEVIVYESYFAIEITDLIRDIIDKESILFSIIMSARQYSGNPVIGMAKENEKETVDSLLCQEEIKKVLPIDVSFMWKKESFGEEGIYYSLFAVKTTNSLPLNPETVKKIKVEKSSYDRELIIELYPDSRQKWAEMTKDNIGRCLSFVCDGMVLSYPMVNAEITGGKLAICSNFTTEEAYTMMGFVKGGALNCPAYISK